MTLEQLQSQCLDAHNYGTDGVHIPQEDVAEVFNEIKDAYSRIDTLEAVIRYK